tara:strand:+ start:5948 stop:6136 length:189 start_codon:yes stop_codon:yes gene_type:complete
VSERTELKTDINQKITRKTKNLFGKSSILIDLINISLRNIIEIKIINTFGKNPPKPMDNGRK